MAAFKEYDRYDGVGLAELVQKKEVSPAEICDAAIERINEVNPKVNAVITPMFEIARNLANQPSQEGPLGGVPFLLKDLLAAYAGVPLTNGSKAFKNYIPEKDSELVTRFKASGLNILGKTNCPEFGLLGVTEPELHGITRNPWNLNHTPGGSSGGSAAAVSSGMVPLASAGDGGGSIRIPAACCGLFGLKPSRGRNPTGPEHGEIWQGAVVEHVVCRSVRDSAAVLDATHGPDLGAPYFIPPPSQAYSAVLSENPKPLRIAFNTKSPIKTEVSPECIQAVEETVQLLEKLGHHLEEAEPEIDGIALAMSYMTMYFGEMAADIAELSTVLNRKARPSDVELLTWTLALLGKTFSAGDFVKSMRLWNGFSRVMGNFHQNYDLYLTPTMAYPPVQIGELQPTASERFLMKVVNGLGLGKMLKASGLTEKMAVDSLTKTPFTQLANLTGQPAMSVPLFWTDGGLPIGLHFIAPFGDETTLFQLAAQLEREKPWFDKRPIL